MKKYTIQLIVIISLLTSFLIFSQTIPHTINYQGLIKDASGIVVTNGDYNLTFKIYDVETDGSELWTETKSITITDGIVNTQLGSIVPIDLPFDKEYWLGITVATESELSPRVKLSSVPYSFMSMYVPDASLTSEKIADGQVVKSINSLTDDVNLVAGANITIVPSGNNLTINAAGGGGGTLGGSGTINYIPVFTNSTTLGNSNLVQDVAGMRLTNNLSNNINPTFSLTRTGTNSATSLSFTNSTGSTMSLGLRTDGKFGISSLNNNVGMDDAMVINYATKSIGIGTFSPLYPLHVSTNRKYAGYFTSDSASSNTHVLHSEYTGTIGNVRAVYGKSTPRDYDGIGGEFIGGYQGCTGTVTATGSNSYYGVYGQASGGTGHNYAVYGNASGSGNNYGIYGRITGNGFGIYGRAPMYGIEGHAENTSGIADGIRGISYSTGGTGVFGWVDANSDLMNYGGYFVTRSTAGIGVLGFVSATTGINYGGNFQSNSTSGRGVYGLTTATTGTTYGVYGESRSTSLGAAVYGDGAYVGVWGQSSGRWGVYGRSTGTSSSYGVYGTVSTGTGNYAGYFAGNVNVSGTLSKSAGSFKIDHPLDPQNKYLLHSFVESPDMMNIYNGNIITDGSGYATITLPDWFEALNKDFRYQLTVIGDFAQAIIYRKIQNNQFTIRTDKPNVEVSWQVTGIRHDAYAEQNRIQVEQMKNGEELGKYLYPEGFGLPNDFGIDAQRQKEMDQAENEKQNISIQRELNSIDNSKLDIEKIRTLSE